MTISRTARIAMVAAMLAVAGTGTAAERGFYAGAGYFDVNADYAERPDVIAFLQPMSAAAVEGAAALGMWDALPLDQNGYKILTGYRLFDWLAIEAEYSDLGGNERPLLILCAVAPCPDRTRSDTNSVTVSALGLYPIGKFDVFARAGVSRHRTSLDTLSDDRRVFSRSESDTDATFGFGVQYQVSQVLTRLEVQRQHFGPDSADITTLGFAYAF